MSNNNCSHNFTNHHQHHHHHHHHHHHSHYLHQTTCYLVRTTVQTCPTIVSCQLGWTPDLDQSQLSYIKHQVSLPQLHFSLLLYSYIVSFIFQQSIRKSFLTFTTDVANYLPLLRSNDIRVFPILFLTTMFFSHSN